VQTDFIPVVANTQDLQYHYSPARTWFLALVDRSMKEQVSTRSGSKLSGEAIGASSTRHDLNRQVCQTNDPQGMYVCGPDGTPYGFTNDHDPPDILKYMDRCLVAYRAHPPKPTVVTEAEKNTPFSIQPAPTTQVLQTFARIPNVPKGSSFLNEGVGRDFVWLYANEAASLVAHAQKSGGMMFPLPETFARRLARFHLLDNVRGTPDLWEAKDIRQLRLQARTVANENGVLTVKFSGPFAMQNASGKRGYGGSLDGYLTIDARTHQVARCQAFADGKAWGIGTFTPNAPPGKFRLIIALVDTKDIAARIVPPEEVATYNRDTRYRNP
jgi:hypothetical protein